jgi:hypothetical protein
MLPGGPLLPFNPAMRAPSWNRTTVETAGRKDYTIQPAELQSLARAKFCLHPKNDRTDLTQATIETHNF